MSSASSLVSEAWQHLVRTSSSPVAASLCSRRSISISRVTRSLLAYFRASSVYSAAWPSLDAATTSLLPASNSCMASTEAAVNDQREIASTASAPSRSGCCVRNRPSSHVVDRRLFADVLRAHRTPSTSASVFKTTLPTLMTKSVVNYSCNVAATLIPLYFLRNCFWLCPLCSCRPIWLSACPSHTAF